MNVTQSSTHRRQPKDIKYKRFNMNILGLQTKNKEYSTPTECGYLGFFPFLQIFRSSGAKIDELV